MKKAIAIAALACAAMGMNAEVVTYDFNNSPEFFPYLQAPIDDELNPGMGQTGNFDFIDKTGSVKVPYGVGVGEMLCYYTLDTDGTTKIWHNREDLIVRISLADGISYGLDANGKYTYEGEQLDMNYPFIGYYLTGKGPSRVVWMPAWGSEDEYVDAAYNAVDADNWVSTKRAIQFSRNDNSGERGNTYIQFPEFQGPFTCTYYIASISDTKRSKEQDLRCKVVPVKDGETELEELAQIINEPYAEIVDKRYYKKVFTYTGTDKVAVRIAAVDKQMGLFHVVFESGADSAIENIIADTVDENAPIYNIMGQRVDESYKGLVIKNGVKYIQK